MASNDFFSAAVYVLLQTDPTATTPAANTANEQQQFDKTNQKAPKEEEEGPKELTSELLADEYRKGDAARPVDEGKYVIVEHQDHAELAYVLEMPEEP